MNLPRQFISQTEKFPLTLSLTPVGRDLLAVLTGGDSHIGASALAFPGMQSIDDVLVSVVPGHREEDLARGIAFALMQAYEGSVQVCAGIHFDDISKKDIKDICKRARELCETACEYMHRRLRRIRNENCRIQATDAE